MTSIYIGIAGILGALTRYGCSMLWNSALPENFPWGTLFCNFSGSFVLSFIAFSRLNRLPTQWKLPVTTGFIGSFTTFSSMSYETFAMFDAGYVVNGIIYMLLSLWGGLLFAWFGSKMTMEMSFRGFRS